MAFTDVGYLLDEFAKVTYICMYKNIIVLQEIRLSINSIMNSNDILNAKIINYMYNLKYFEMCKT